MLWTCIFSVLKNSSPLKWSWFFSGWAPVASWIKPPPSDLFPTQFAAMPSFSIVVEPESNFISSDKFENFRIVVKARWGNVAWHSEYFVSILFWPDSRIFLFAFLKKFFHQNNFCCVRAKWPFLKFSQSDYFSSEGFKIHRHLFSISCLGNYSTITTKTLLQPLKQS